MPRTSAGARSAVSAAGGARGRCRCRMPGPVEAPRQRGATAVAGSHGGRRRFRGALSRAATGGLGDARRRGHFRKPLLHRRGLGEPRLEVGGEAVLHVEQVRHPAVDDRRAQDRARRHLDDAGRDPQSSRLPLVAAADDPAGAQRAPGGDAVRGRPSTPPAQDRQTGALERRGQGLDDADAVPVVHVQAGDVGEGKNGDAAAGLRPGALRRGSLPTRAVAGPSRRQSASPRPRTRPRATVPPRRR